MQPQTPSLPNRQLRNMCGCMSVLATASLPNRQLRNFQYIYWKGFFSSLPNRQLRKGTLKRSWPRFNFTAE